MHDWTCKQLLSQYIGIRSLLISDENSEYRYRYRVSFFFHSIHFQISLLRSVSFGMLDWRASGHKIAFQQAHVSFSHSKFAIIDCNIACLSLPQPRFCNDTYMQISCKVISSNRLLNSDLHNEYLCYDGSLKIVSDMDRLISLTDLWLFLLPNILITSRHYYR